MLSDNLAEHSFLSTAIIMITVAALFLLVGLYLDGVQASVSKKQLSGQAFGPLTVERPLEAVTIELSHLPPPNSWTYIETIISGKDEKALFSFGEEFYHESSISHLKKRILVQDVGAANTRIGPKDFFEIVSKVPSFKTGSRIKLFLPGESAYTLHFLSESATVKDCGKRAKPAQVIIDVTVHFHRGDSYWHYFVGCVLLAAGAAFFFIWKLFPRSNFRYTNGIVVILVTGFIALTSAAVAGFDLETDPGRHWGAVDSGREFIAEPSIREGSSWGPDHRGGSLMGGK
jgi:hypothetical protein